MLILNYSWAVWLAWLLAVFFAVSGGLSLIGNKPPAHVLFGRPLVSAILMVMIGVLIAWYPTRVLGLALAALFAVVMLVKLARGRDWRQLAPSAVLFFVVGLTAWGLRLF